MRTRLSQGAILPQGARGKLPRWVEYLGGLLCLMGTIGLFFGPHSADRTGQPIPDWSPWMTVGGIGVISLGLALLFFSRDE